MNMSYPVQDIRSCCKSDVTRAYLFMLRDDQRHPFVAEFCVDGNRAW